MKNSLRISKRLLWMVIFLLALGACSQATEPNIDSTNSESNVAGVATNETDNADGNTPVNVEGDADTVVSVDPALVDTPPIKVSEGTQQTTNDGLSVGFTEDGYPYMGSLDAPVVIEEFSDFQCPYCSRFHNQTLPFLLENQIAEGEVLFIYRDFPLSIHPQAPAAANAARCAGEIGGAVAYWDMHDALFNTLGQWSGDHANEYFKGLAAQIDLDETTFAECVDTSKHMSKVQTDFNAGRNLGVSSTPSFFINNQPLIGAQPLTSFEQAITAALSGEIPAQVQATEPQPSAPVVAPTPASIHLDDYAYAYGDPDAPVTIVEFTDYQCPFCNRHVQQVFPQLMEEMVDTGRVYYIVKDLPLESIHPAARAAHNAARCAGDQDMYSEMHDVLFTQQSVWSNNPDVNGALISLATDLGMNEETFAECLNTLKYDSLVQANLQEAFSLGAQGTPFFFVDGFPLSGARPIEHFQLAVEMAEEGTLAEAFVPRATPTPAAAPSVPTGPVNVSLDGGLTYGNPDAPVTIVEFTDYQCPFCNRHHQQTFPLLLESYIETGQVYYVVKDFPLTSIHPQAPLAAEAVHCADEQGQYSAMAHALFTNLQQWNGQQNAGNFFVQYASDLPIDLTQFQECLNTGKYRAVVSSNQQEGYRLGVSGTPAFFVNGNFVSGAQPYEVFVQAIEQAKGYTEQ